MRWWGALARVCGMLDVLPRRGGGIRPAQGLGHLAVGRRQAVWHEDREGRQDADPGEQPAENVTRVVRVQGDACHGDERAEDQREDDERRRQPDPSWRRSSSVAGSGSGTGRTLRSICCPRPDIAVRTRTATAQTNLHTVLNRKMNPLVLEGGRGSYGVRVTATSVMFPESAAGFGRGAGGESAHERSASADRRTNRRPTRSAQSISLCLLRDSVYFGAAASDSIRRFISSGETSSTCVATCHT